MMNKAERPSNVGNAMSAKLQQLSELKKALNKKLAGEKEEVKGTPYIIEYKENGTVDLTLRNKVVKNFEDKGKLLGAIWDKNWEVIIQSIIIIIEDAKPKRRKKADDIPN